MADDEMIETGDLQSKLADGAAMLIDVRDADAFATAHPAGAINIPIGELAARAEELAARLAELPVGVEVVTSCGGGTRGPRAAARLRETGIDARALRGGLRAWRAAGLPIAGTEAGDTPPERT